MCDHADKTGIPLLNTLEFFDSNDELYVMKDSNLRWFEVQLLFYLYAI